MLSGGHSWGTAAEGKNFTSIAKPQHLGIQLFHLQDVAQQLLASEVLHTVYLSRGSLLLGACTITG